MTNTENENEKLYKGQIPFGSMGNQLHYPEPSYYFFIEWDSNTKIGKLEDGKVVDLSQFVLKEDIYSEPKNFSGWISSNAWYVARVIAWK